MDRKRVLFALIILIMPTFLLPTTSSPSPVTVPSTLLQARNGATSAFNVTYAVLNDTTASQAMSGPTACPNAQCTIVGNSFNFLVNSTSATSGRQDINWTIPILGNANVCTSCAKVFLDFQFFTPKGAGLRIDTGSNATYALYNGNTQVTSQTQGNTIPLRSASVSGLCPDPTFVCFDATGQIGDHLTLMFRFKWEFPTGTNAHTLSAQVGSVRLIAPAFGSSSAHAMSLSSATVTHTSAVSAFNYNQSVTFTDHSTNTQVTATWPQLELTLYYPTGYTISSVTNTTGGPAFTIAGTRYCKAADCALFNVTAASLTFPSAPQKSAFQFAITATSSNTVTSVETVVGSVAPAIPAHWMPGETMSLNATNVPSVSFPGTLTVTPVHSSGTHATPTQFGTTSGGQFNLVAPTTPLGMWTLVATFGSPYDYGNATTTIVIEHLKLVSSAQQLLKISGDNTAISVSGTINLEGSGGLSAPIATDVGVFAISTTTSGPYLKTNPAQVAGLYVSNTTFVNGAFTSGEPLVMFITITNPSSTPTLGNVTINHENVSGQLHGINVTFAIDKLDNPPLVSGSRTYEVDVTFNNGQVTLKVTSLKTGGQLAVTSNGRSSPVFSARQQFGLFNITVTSTPSSPGWVSGAITTTNSVETQPFAYVFTNSLLSQGGRVLASQITTTDVTGAFSAILNSSLIFQGRHVAYIALARDANGIALGNQDPTGATDTPLLCGTSSGTCQPTVTAPTEATPGQALNIGLKLHNNSTDLTMNLHITLQVFSGTNLLTTASQPVTIAPGQTQSLSFNFNAPSTLGTFSVEFSSPEYGAPIYTTTLNVLAIPSWLQVAIPAIIGVVIAAVAVVYRARKPSAMKTGAEEKTKQASPRSGPRNP